MPLANANDGNPVHLLAIDPGTNDSAYVFLRDGAPYDWAIVPNGELLRLLRGHLVVDAVYVEKIEAMGMAVGRETFDTVRLTGRIEEIVGDRIDWVTRREVKLHLCGSMRAKDPNVRQALIDRFGGAAQTKKGGTLYKLASHCWAALAVAVTANDTKRIGMAKAV